MWGRDKVRITTYNMTPEVKRHVVNMFKQHPATKDQTERYEVLRGSGANLADLIMRFCPDTDERVTAIERLRESIMWANNAIANGETKNETQD